ncbi:MAG TPA: hypothetical protein VFB19_18485 [Mycobacterium sp.]|nr:hypothetical protein [Mycobacterium sp.]
MTSDRLPEPGQVTFLVGTSYNGRPPNHWSVWHKSYDEIIETLRKQQGDIKPDGSRFIVLEVMVRDRTFVASEVTVS